MVRGQSLLTLDGLPRTPPLRSGAMGMAIFGTGILTTIFYQTESLPPPGGSRTYYFPLLTYTVTDMGLAFLIGPLATWNFSLGVVFTYPLFHIADVIRCSYGLEMPETFRKPVDISLILPTYGRVLSFSLLTFVGSILPVPLINFLNISIYILWIFFGFLFPTRVAVGLGLSIHFTFWWLLSIVFTELLRKYISP